MERKEGRQRRRQSKLGRVSALHSSEAGILSRRNLLLGGGALTVASFLAYCGLSQGQREYPIRSSTPARPKTPDEEYTEFVTRRLNELDRQFDQFPNRFDELAMHTSNLAAEVFCLELGYSRELVTSLTSAIKLEGQQEFLSVRADLKACLRIKGDDPISETVAYIDLYTDNIHVDKDKARALRGMNGGQGIGKNLFAILVHEYHHFNAKKKKSELSMEIDVEESGTRFTADMSQGARVFGAVPENSRSGEVCFESQGYVIEEAIVMDSSDRIYSKYGLKFTTVPELEYAKAKYRQEILGRFFNNDHRLVLVTQQASGALAIYQAVGHKLGDADKEAISTGFHHLINTLTIPSKR